MLGIDFVRMKQLAPLGEVMRLLGLPFSRQSATVVRGRCPLGCAPDPKACRYDGTSNLWYCHRCKVGGSALDLYSRVKRVDIYLACLELCELLHREIPYLSVVPALKDRAVKDSDPAIDTGG